jgi:hypothetical protein
VAGDAGTELGFGFRELRPLGFRAAPLFTNLRNGGVGEAKDRQW